LRENLHESRPCPLGSLVGRLRARPEEYGELRSLPALTIVQNHGEAVLD
jgi:hypothetical protein